MTPSFPRDASAARPVATDSCGCAMSARFLGLSILVSVGWLAWHWGDYSPFGAAVRVLIFVFAAATLGKLVGIAVYRARSRAGLRP
jgi:hypothetical protein